MKKKKDMVWRSHVKKLFEEIIEHGGHAVSAAHTPLRLTYSILIEVAQRANELQDPKLNSLMARLALYEECDPASPHYNGHEFTEMVITQDPKLYPKDPNAEIKDKMQYYLSNEPSEFDKIIEHLEKANEHDPHMGLNMVEDILIWEPLEGYFTVHQFCELVGIS